MPDVKIYKIIIIGQDQSGKTALMNQEINNHFIEKYSPTIGTDFMIKTYNAGTPNQKKVRLWDLAGQERFDGLSSAYFQKSDAAIICVAPADLLNEDYLNNKISVLRQINPYIPITLVSTKADLVESESTAIQLELFARQNDCDFAKVCAKDGDAVSKLFQRVTNNINPLIDVISVESDSLSSLIEKIQPLPDQTDEQKAFKLALEQLAVELDNNLKQLKNLSAVNQTISATHKLLTALTQAEPEDRKIIFQTYQNDCPRQSSNLLSKLIKIVIVTGLCAAVGAALTAGILGLSLGVVVGISASVGAAGLLSSSLIFFKQHPFDKAVDAVVKNGINNDRIKSF